MLRLEKDSRQKLWRRLVDAIESYQEGVDKYPVAGEWSRQEIDSALACFNFQQPIPAAEAVDFVVGELTRHQVHAPHPAYYGLFNPAPTTMGIAGDLLAAAFNPQLATWSHSPFAVQVEQHLVKTFAEYFGYNRSRADGTFTSGGAEANATALFAALNYHFPQLRLKGLRSLPAQPVFYVAAEAHHSLVKAAICAGLGLGAVREIPADDDLRMDVDSLVKAIKEDKQKGCAPFMIVATAGSTNAGVIDPIPEIAQVAAGHHLWLHLDAAWGGACVFVPELKELLAGAQDADSITFDCHKWLSVPMGAGMFLTKHGDVLERTFKVSADYMPKGEGDRGASDPYAHSLQWSRRFIGLKVFLSLLVAGVGGYADAIRHQVKIGEHLRDSLSKAGWQVVNKTPLPLVCFVDRQSSDGPDAAHLEEICRQVVSSGTAWISTTRISNGRTVLRACITNYRTGPEHIAALIDALAMARQKAQKVSV